MQTASDLGPRFQPDNDDLVSLHSCLYAEIAPIILRNYAEFRLAILRSIALCGP
jgi:hypothetical protein